MNIRVKYQLAVLANKSQPTRIISPFFETGNSIPFVYGEYERTYF